MHRHKVLIHLLPGAMFSLKDTWSSFLSSDIRFITLNSASKEAKVSPFGLCYLTSLAIGKAL